MTQSSNKLLSELEISFKGALAKADRADKESYLSLYIHSMDAILLSQKLFDHWLPEQTKRAISEDEEQLRSYLGLVCGLHDIGKFSATFQNKLNEIADYKGFKYLKPNGRTTKGGLHHSLTGQVLVYNHLKEGNPNAATQIASLVGAHHGAPQEKSPKWSESCLLHDKPDEFFNEGDSEQWAADVKRCIDLVCQLNGFQTAESIPVFSDSSLLLVSGFMIMVDWIISNIDFYPYSNDIDSQSLISRSEEAWERIKLTLPWKSNPFNFEKVFGFEPNGLQKNVIELVAESQNPGLLIIEAPMGTGKTEAALAAAQIMAAKTKAGGIFFGLPTQASSNIIFTRLHHWAEQQFDGITHTIRLAHNDALYNPEFQEILNFSNVDSDQNEKLVAHPWMIGRKQVLLSEFVIGTIDQLLASTLPQKHIALKHLGMAGKVVILDEVHSYDAFTSFYLKRTLEWLGNYRVPVVLLSATLSSEQKNELVKAYGCKLPEIKEQSYPSITLTQQGMISTRAVVQSSSSKVYVDELPVGDPVSIKAYLDLIEAEKGCGAIIVNSVRRAQQLYDYLKNEWDKGEILLAHSRFRSVERTDLENRIVNLAGKRSQPEQRKGVLVIGTQVLQESLDLDFDYMLSELAPVDLLLQRAGRLQRHSRVRDEAFSKKTLTVLPIDKEYSVYDEWILNETEKVFPDSLVFPQDIRRLNELVYSSFDENDELFKTYLKKKKKKNDKADEKIISEPSRTKNKGLSKTLIINQSARSVRDIDFTFPVYLLDESELSSLKELKQENIFYELNRRKINLPDFPGDESFKLLWEERVKQNQKQIEQEFGIKGFYDDILILNNGQAVIGSKKFIYDSRRGLSIENKESANE